MNLFVGNLPFTCKESHLKAVFEEHGFHSTSVRIIRRPDGGSKGFGFVEIEGDTPDAEAVIQKLSTIELNRRRMIVALAKEQHPRSAQIAQNV
jgi:RNA recognition motif-containing protein